MGTIKALVGFLAIIAVFVCLFQVAPPLMANYSFQDDLKTEAMMAGANFPERTRGPQRHPAQGQRARLADRGQAGDGAAHQHAGYIGGVH